MSTTPRMIVIPKGTAPGLCKGKDCQRRDIYWVEQRRKKDNGIYRLPVDAAVEGGSEPDSLSDGLGQSHFETCPNDGDF